MSRCPKTVKHTTATSTGRAAPDARVQRSALGPLREIDDNFDFARCAQRIACHESG
jgi:hypothetical protein